MTNLRELQHTLKHVMHTLYNRTPLIHSHPLSRLSGRNIFLKCESFQPSGSFKDRGIGALCQYYASQKVKGFVSSSGGNAGLSVAYAAAILKIPATIIIPKSTPPLMIAKLKAEGAQVHVEGDIWDEADQIAKQIANEQDLAYIPPFNHPIIWEGYHSLVEELKSDKLKPDAIILSVGGGGLYSGVVQGLMALGFNDTVMITAETLGAASFATAMAQKKRVRLDKIETVAVTLGAKQICERAFELSQTYPTLPQTVSDKEAVEAVLHFANDHRMLVEPACGASLAIVYLQREILQQFKNVVVVVCGGSGVNLALLAQWKKQFAISDDLLSS